MAHQAHSFVLLLLNLLASCVALPFGVGNECTTVSTSTANYAYIWRKEPVDMSKGMIFQITARSDAYIGLASANATNQIVFEIVIGGANNQRSVIRSGSGVSGSAPELAAATTLGILGNTFARDFWVQYANGLIQVGRGIVLGADVFLSYTVPTTSVPLGTVRNVGVSTGYGYTGSWVYCTSIYALAKCFPFDTSAVYGYQFLQQDISASTGILFSIRAAHDAYIGLSSANTTMPAMYEIVLGGDSNNINLFRRVPQGTILILNTLDGIMTGEFIQVWVQWNNGTINIGTGAIIGNNVLMTYRDPIPLPIRYVGVSTGVGAAGSFQVCPESICDPARAYRTNNTCELLRICAATQYMTVASTPTTNRLCGNLSQCVPGQIEFLAPTTTSDRVCSNCSAGTVDLDGNPLTTCTPCANGTYADRPGMTSCVPARTCAAGEEEVVPLTAYANRVCRSCVLGATFKPLPGQAQNCTLVQTCAAGEERVVAATLTSDATCGPCRPGYFSPQPGPVCRPISLCAAGYEMVLGATAVSDVVCDLCPAEQFKTTAGNVNCSDATVCLASQYERKALTVFSDRVCANVTQCAVGTYLESPATRTTDAVCTKCSVCPPGSRVVTPCSAMADAVCETCVLCTETQYRVTQCTATAPTVCNNCTSCTASQYMKTPCRNTADTVCMPLTVCTADEYEVVEAGADHDRECVALTQCGAAEYELTAPTATTDRECDLLSVCTATEREVVAATPTSDRVCGLCPLGSSSAGNGTCITCEPGTSAPLGAIGPCIPCAPGTVTADATQPCTACGAETFTSTSGAASCTAATQCGVGEEELRPVSPIADRLCRACLLGVNFKALPGNTACIPVTDCAPGFGELNAPTETSNRVCEACVPGVSWSAAVDGARCTPVTLCGAGLVQSVAPTTSSDRHCTQCDFGSFKAGTEGSCVAWTQCTEEQWETRAPSTSVDRLCINTTRITFTVAHITDRAAARDTLMGQMRNASVDVTAVLAIVIDGRRSRRATAEPSFVEIIVNANRADVVAAIRAMLQHGDLGTPTDPPPAAATGGKDTESVSLLSIILIAVGAACLVLALLFLIFTLILRRRLLRRQPVPAQPPVETRQAYRNPIYRESRVDSENGFINPNFAGPQIPAAEASYGELPSARGPAYDNGDSFSGRTYEQLPSPKGAAAGGPITAQSRYSTLDRSSSTQQQQGDAPRVQLGDPRYAGLTRTYHLEGDPSETSTDPHHSVSTPATYLDVSGSGRTPAGVPPTYYDVSPQPASGVAYLEVQQTQPYDAYMTLASAQATVQPGDVDLQLTPRRLTQEESSFVFPMAKTKPGSG